MVVQAYRLRGEKYIAAVFFSNGGAVDAAAGRGRFVARLDAGATDAEAPFVAPREAEVECGFKALAGVGGGGGGGGAAGGLLR